MDRRSFVHTLALVPSMATAAGGRNQGILFKARGKAGIFGGGEKLAFVRADGSGQRVFDFGRPTHTGWGVYDLFGDGRRAVLMSIEMNEDWKTKPFQEFYAKSRTHIWACDVFTGVLEEIAQKDRVAPFYAPCALVPGEEKLLAGVQMGGRERLHIMNLDGSDPRPITGPNEYVYGVSVSPDGKSIAFHADYRIHTARLDGSGRKEIAGKKGELSFGTSWSPDGGWVLYQVCHPQSDPGHDWSDIWIGRPDGSENRQLTQDQSAWFASSYGKPDNPGNGSIMPKWAPDGSGILYARRLPGSKTPWEFQKQRPDSNHFNRDFKPELARGGVEICFLDPKTGESTPLSRTAAPQWDYRPEWSPDSQRILFCRALTGENPWLWVMDRNGKNQRKLTQGLSGQGAEFPRWLRG